MVLAFWYLGYPEQALRASREMRKLAHSIGHPFSLAYAQHHTSWLYHQLRLPTQIKAASEEGIQTTAEQGYAMFHATQELFGIGGRWRRPPYHSFSDEQMERLRAFYAGLPKIADVVPEHATGEMPAPAGQ